jgi:hypothetical protein
MASRAPVAPVEAPVEASVEAPVEALMSAGLDNWVFSASRFNDVGASDRLELTADMTAPQASHCVAPALKFLPQFIQNVMDVVLYPVQKISSYAPGSLRVIWQIGLLKSACSLNQNRADENQNLRRPKLYKPPPIDIIRVHSHEWDLWDL